MANSFNQEEVILFENVLERFDSDNTIANEASMFSQPDASMQRQGDTVWRPMPMVATTVDGLDVTSSIGDVNGLSVPASLSTIINVPWEFDAKEARDSYYRDEKARAGAQALSARVNRMIADNVGNTGSLVVTKASNLGGYDDIANAETLMIEQDIADTQKAMVLNARDWQKMSKDLADRTLQPRSERALSHSAVGPVAGFNTFRTSYTRTLQAAGGGATTVDGAQKHVPASTSEAGTGETQNVDNRFMNLTVDNSGGVAVGDAFTIAGVNALSMINKKDTGQLRTFRVTEVVNGTTIKITPAIIVGGASDAETDYANCSAQAADNAVITWLNTTQAPTNVFWCNNSIEIFSGKLAFTEDMAGVSVMRQSTDSGVEIIFAKQGNAKTGKAFYRLTAFLGVTNLNPQMNGIVIGNQA